MRRFALVLPFAALFAASQAVADTTPQTAATATAAGLATVAVEVKRVQPGKGMVYISLCTEQEFLRRCGFRQKTESSADRVSVTFEGVPPGRYAASAWQDIGDDREMRRGMFGEPLEPLGSSRDAVGMMGPPSFEDAAFDVAGGTIAQSFSLR